MARHSRGSGGKGAGTPREAAAQTPPALPRGRHGLSRVGRQKALVLATRHTSFASPLLARAQIGLASSSITVPAFARQLRHHTTLPALPAIDPFSGQAGLSGALLRRYETFLSPWWERQPGAAVRRGHLYTRLAPASLAHRRRAARMGAFEDAGIESMSPTLIDAPVAAEPPALSEAAMQDEPAWEAGWDAPPWEGRHESLTADAVTAVERAHALSAPMLPVTYREPLSLPSLRPASDLLVSPLSAALAPASPAMGGEGEEAASLIARTPEQHTTHTAGAQEWRQRFYGWEQWQPTFMPAGPLPLAVSQEMPDVSDEEGAAEETEPDGFARSDGTPALPSAPLAPPVTALPGVFGLIASIQRRARDGAGTPAADQRARALAYAAQSSGRPLDAASAALMRATLGSRFEGVRVHADVAAAQAAAALGAHAFTVGQNVYFAESAYAPETPAGLALLGHELAHTLQQGGTLAGVRAGLSGLAPAGSTGEAAESTAAFPISTALQRSALSLGLAALPSGPGPVAFQPSGYVDVPPPPGGELGAALPAASYGADAGMDRQAAFHGTPGSGVSPLSLLPPQGAGSARSDEALLDRTAPRPGSDVSPYLLYPLFAPRGDDDAARYVPYQPFSGAMASAAGLLAGPPTSAGVVSRSPTIGATPLPLPSVLLASHAAPDAPLDGSASATWAGGIPPMALITTALSPWVSAAARLAGSGTSGTSALFAAPVGSAAEGRADAPMMAAALPAVATSASATETPVVGQRTQDNLAPPTATPQAGEHLAPALNNPSVAPYAASLTMTPGEGRILSPFSDAGMLPAGALPSVEPAGAFGAARLVGGADGAQSALASALAGQGIVPGGVLQMMRAAMARQASNEHRPGQLTGFTMRPDASSSLIMPSGAASSTMLPSMMDMPLVPAPEAGPDALLGRVRVGGATAIPGREDPLATFGLPGWAPIDEATAGPAAPVAASPLSLALAAGAGSLGISSGIIARQIAGALGRGVSGVRGGMVPDGGAYAEFAGEPFSSSPASRAGVLSDPAHAPGGTSSQGSAPAQTGQWYPRALREPDGSSYLSAVSYEGAMGMGPVGAADAARVSRDAPSAAPWQPGVDAPAARMAHPLDLAATILARAAGGDAATIAPAALAERANLWAGAEVQARDPSSRPAVLSRAPLALALTGVAPSSDQSRVVTSAAGPFMSPLPAAGAPSAAFAGPFSPVMRGMLAVAPGDTAFGETGRGDQVGAAPPSRALLPAAGGIVSGLAALVDGGIGRVARFARDLVHDVPAATERTAALAPGTSLAADAPTLLTPLASIAGGGHAAAATMTTGSPGMGAPTPDAAMAPAALITPTVLPVQRAASEAARGAETGTAMGIIGRGAALVDALVGRASDVLSLVGEVSAPRPALALSFAGGSGGPGGSGGSGMSMAAGLARVGALATSIQRKAERGAETPTLQRRVTALEQVAESSGQPLGGATGDVMRAALGRDVGAVQVHTDAAAARAADVLGARAFALGRGVYFASGAYAPETPAGLALLGHELVHTMQGYGGAQRAAAAGAPALDADAEPAHLEAEALSTEESLLRLFSANPHTMLAGSGDVSSGVGAAPNAIQREAASLGAMPSMALFAPAIPVVPTVGTAAMGTAAMGTAAMGTAAMGTAAMGTAAMGTAAMGVPAAAHPGAMAGTSGTTTSPATFGALAAVQRAFDGALPVSSGLTSSSAAALGGQSPAMQVAFAGSAFNTGAMLAGHAALQRRFDAGGTDALSGALSGASPWIARFADTALPGVGGTPGAPLVSGVRDAMGLHGYGEAYGTASPAGGALYGNLQRSMLAGLAAGIPGGAPAGMAMAPGGASAGIPVMRSADGAAQAGDGHLSAGPLDMGMRLMRLPIEVGDAPRADGIERFAPGSSVSGGNAYGSSIDARVPDGDASRSGAGAAIGDPGRPLQTPGLGMSLTSVGGTALGMGTSTALGTGMGTPPVQRDVDGLRTLANPGLAAAMNDGVSAGIGLTNAATVDRALREEMVSTADDASDGTSAWGQSVERTLAGHASAPSGLAGMLQRRVDQPGDGIESLAVDAVPMTQRTTPVVVARSADTGSSHGVPSGETWPGASDGSWPGAISAPLSGSNGSAVQRFVTGASTASGGNDAATGTTSAQGAHGATGSGAQGVPNIDELTEQVIRRIKQQLRLDQERMGGYLPDFMR